MLVDPLALDAEEAALRQHGVCDAYARLVIDRSCAIVTPMQKIVGQMREILDRHGSCGMGVGETVRDNSAYPKMMLKAGDKLDPKILNYKLDFIWRLKMDQAEQIASENISNAEIQQRYNQLMQADLVGRLCERYNDFAAKVSIRENYHLEYPSVFEGAQGILLDFRHGFWPHVTKTDTTFNNANDIVDDSVLVKKIGVLRAYSTRHGNGPFVTEDVSLSSKIPDMHNKHGEWQGRFRVGWFDALAARYAIDAVGGVDGIALTNLDRLKDAGDIRACTSYEYVGNACIDGFFDYEVVAGRKIVHAIKAEDDPYRERQHALKERLDGCRPVYSSFGSLDSFLSFIESKEGAAAPIMITSNGPERKGKKLLF